MLQYTKKLNPAVFVPTFFLVILEIAKTFSSILLPQYFIDDITNRSSIRQTMFHLAILIIAIFGIQIFRAAITPYIFQKINHAWKLYLTMFRFDTLARNNISCKISV